MRIYKTTEVMSVAQGTVIAEIPSSKPTSGAKAKTIIVSFNATWDSVNSGSPFVGCD
jgi:hypothetical protein